MGKSLPRKVKVGFSFSLGRPLLLKTFYLLNFHCFTHCALVSSSAATKSTIDTETLQKVKDTSLEERQGFDVTKLEPTGKCMLSKLFCQIVAKGFFPLA